MTRGYFSHQAMAPSFGAWCATMAHCGKIGGNEEPENMDITRKGLAHLLESNIKEDTDVLEFRGIHKPLEEIQVWFRVSGEELKSVVSQVKKTGIEPFLQQIENTCNLNATEVEDIVPNTIFIFA